ncbi:MAG: hypothetical protein WD875_11520 [Pirellulales bacterium]
MTQRRGWNGRWLAVYVFLLALASTGCARLFGDSPKASGDDVAAEKAESKDDAPPLNLPLKTSGGNQLMSDVLIYQGWRIQHNVVFDHYRLLDPQDVRRAWGTREQCEKRFEEIKREEKIEPPRGKCVVVVHGLWRNRDAMQAVTDYLRDEGKYHVVSMTYASTRESIGKHAEHLASVIEGLDTVDEINFVGCSLGNLVIRRYLAEAEKKAKKQSKDGKLDPRFKRFVMLAPPNQGAQVARRFASDAVVSAAWGVPGEEIAEWEKLAMKLATPPFEFGILAGGKGTEKVRNPLIDGDDDYMLAVDETKLDGARDFVVLPVTHASIKRDPTALEYTLRFLQHGYFKTDAERHPLPERR